MPLDVFIPAATSPAAREPLPAFAAIHDYPPADGWPADPLPADVLVVTAVGAALAAIPHLAGLRVVQTLSAGVDRIVDRLPVGLTLCNASGVHDIGVAEWILMAILAVFRRLPELVDAQRAGTWAKLNPGSVAAGDEEPTRGDELNGSRVLIVGYGSIGRAIEERLRPFGVEVVRVARTPLPADAIHGINELPSLLPAADVVVVLLPLTASTRGVFGAKAIGGMKPGALVVNAARGAIVDSA